MVVNLCRRRTTAGRCSARSEGYNGAFRPSFLPFGFVLLLVLLASLVQSHFFRRWVSMLIMRFWCRCGRESGTPQHTAGMRRISVEPRGGRRGRG